MSDKMIAIAGGSGFIGGAIARRLGAIAGLRPRILTRNPEAARRRFDGATIEFAHAEIADPASLKTALEGADAIVNAIQFDGYPIENPARGMTFERVDYGGTIALLAAGKLAGAGRFVYISGAAADESSSHPGFRAKGKAERAIRESGIPYTILRPSLVYGPGDKVVNGFARALKFAPLFPVPGTGRQKIQPVLVDDLAACVALALAGRGVNGTYEIGGPDLMTFDELIRLVMEITGRRRPIVHIPEALMRAAGAIAEKLPWALFSRDAVTFVTADNACDIGPLVAEFGIQLTPAREGMAYLARPTDDTH
jgi:NADH dehydrogenase